MLNISSWTETFLQALEDIFGSRVWFVVNVNEKVSQALMNF